MVPNSDSRSIPFDFASNPWRKTRMFSAGWETSTGRHLIWPTQYGRRHHFASLFIIPNGFNSVNYTIVI